ncbi:hypothetical protein BH23BAC1_BH23BAC1_44150 [soil metagenome]
MVWFLGEKELITPSKVEIFTFPFKKFRYSLKSIPTVLDGVSFSEGLQSIGKLMDKGTITRSYVAVDLGHILNK